MTGWSFLVYVCTPIPLLLLVILTVPLPIWLRRAVLTATKKVIFLPLVAGVQAIHVMLCVTAVAFGDQMYRTSELRSRERPAMIQDVEAWKGKVWRAERNLWIALFSFFVWWMLSAYYRTLVRYLEVKDENTELKKRLNPEPEQQAQRPTDKKND